MLDDGASYADLNVSRIAERAGRPRTAFYAHFEDRRALLLALVDEVGGEALTAIGPFLSGHGPTRYEEVTASIEGLIATFREHRTLLRAVIKAANYDEGIATYWDGIIARFVDAARTRLQSQGFSEDRAAGTATALIWMMERMCYQQVVRESTGLSDPAAVAGISEVWLSVLHGTDGRSPTSR